MRQTITLDTQQQLGKGSFQIRRIRPGLGIDPDDTGFGVLGLVDRAHLSAGLVVDMHEHRDDEIVSYLRSGALTHTDSAGCSETITRDRLMVMNAGTSFSHEERMPEGEDIHMLQIFLRPREAGLPPEIQFVELQESSRMGGWRTIVEPEGSEVPEHIEVPDHAEGPGNLDEPDDSRGLEGGNAAVPATVRQQAYIHDVHVEAGKTIELPRRPGWNQWLYVFSGTIALADGEKLSEGAAIAADYDDRIDAIEAVEASDLVLFELAAGASFTLAGSLSRGR